MIQIVKAPGLDSVKLSLRVFYRKLQTKILHDLVQNT